MTKKTGVVVITFIMIWVMLVPSRVVAQPAGQGYELWLEYREIMDSRLASQYSRLLETIAIPGESPTRKIIMEELELAADGLLKISPNITSEYASDATLVIAKFTDLPSGINISREGVNEEGYSIQAGDAGNPAVIAAHTDVGLLYGTFAFLRQLQMLQQPQELTAVSSPQLDIRMLNHWDNLDRTVERGYAGASIWNWHTLPQYIDPRYKDYARANASIGINGTALTNVNANALVLTPAYIEKVAALADVFRPYGIKVYLTARFSAPIELGDLDTADPLDPDVRQWWADKSAEIYEKVPDFGGFLVKANSEGQPGPQDYDRNHADGANMLADAVKPFGGIVMWRAFVYSAENTIDRAGQAYDEFMPLDGSFRENVVIQVKNGPIDFQPREPFSAVFGAMKSSNLMMEFQITQEYLGFSTHLVFLPQLFSEVLESDTYQYGPGSTVAKTLDGSQTNSTLTGMAGVSNIGSDLNWTGHLFGQANWYGFGRLAWNMQLSPEQIAREWLECTFSNDSEFVDPMVAMMIRSREAVVNYMTPLGLHHIFDAGHHYGPGPWLSQMSRPDWTAVYYHKADSAGVGFDRTVATGSGTLAQYADEIVEQYSDPETIPETYLLWFHHVPWSYTMSNGRSLWDNLGIKYQEGVDDVRQMISTWESMQAYVSDEDYEHVRMMLEIQLNEAIWWKNACMLYFQQFSAMDFPPEMTPPDKPLSYYQSLKFPFAPGIRPRW